MLPVAFFVSGLAAVIYQLIWQRVLFGIYGTHIESVTVVVTAFMLGLGAGSLAGGWLADRRGVNAPRAFALIELAIALFGLVSIPFFHWAGRLTTDTGWGVLWAIVFLLLLVPTALMGATLPLLTAFAARRLRNTGAAVAGLYAVNTLGSATGAIVAVLFIAGRLGQQGSVLLAATLNLAAAGIVISLFGTREAKEDAAGRGTPGAGESSTTREPRASRPMPRALLLLVAAASGLIALSFEIVWYRAYATALMARPHAFGVLLGGYLTGIALGAWLGGRMCRRLAPSREALADRLGWVIAAGGIIAFLVLPAFALLVAVSRSWGLATALVAGGAAALGVVFPLVVHGAAPIGRRVGWRTAHVYGANIIGSALGSLVTGFWLMDRAGIAQISTGLSAAMIVLAALVWWSSGTGGSFRLLTTALLLVAVLAGSRTTLLATLQERLVFRVGYSPEKRFAELVENRSGVIGVMHDGAVYGSGVYDGHYNTDLRQARVDLIHRAFALGLFHDAPRRVLMIGLSSGSWVSVVANHPDVERVTVVEINPGYVGLLSHHPVVSNLRTDPRVRMAIDDGRRWLVQHPHERFDVIVANTTYHWRANASSLLSTEFLELVRRHLNPGGVYYFNTTGEPRAQRTAALAFPYGWRVYGMMAVGESPIRPDLNRFSEQLGAYRIYGQPSLDLNAADDRTLRDLIVRDMAADLETREGILERTKDLPVVTDDNMGTEWTRR